jgi:hypothetical protein
MVKVTMVSFGIFGESDYGRIFRLARQPQPFYQSLSKKFENLSFMLAIFFEYYDFCRIQKTLRCTPVMEAGLTKTVGRLKDLTGIK